MKKKIVLLLMLSVIVFILGCIGQKETETSEKDRAIAACKEECNSKLREGVDLSNGPCLLDPISDLQDWVCDVAHEPRQDVDNDPKNQCSAYREGKAHHFVEVDPSCNLIKTW
jgi:hypothetical protein